ncbi:MAG: hypothetical protein JSS27_14925 [Planctomycetes bacterium]|nr:hypothetical protein [Planctomycetota bacterium]
MRKLLAFGMVSLCAASASAQGVPSAPSYPPGVGYGNYGAGGFSGGALAAPPIAPPWRGGQNAPYAGIPTSPNTEVVPLGTPSGVVPSTPTMPGYGVRRTPLMSPSGPAANLWQQQPAAPYNRGAAIPPAESVPRGTLAPWSATAPYAGGPLYGALPYNGAAPYTTNAPVGPPISPSVAPANANPAPEAADPGVGYASGPAYGGPAYDGGSGYGYGAMGSGVRLPKMPLLRRHRGMMYGGSYGAPSDIDYSVGDPAVGGTVSGGAPLAPSMVPTPTYGPASSGGPIVAAPAPAALGPTIDAGPAVGAGPMMGGPVGAGPFDGGTFPSLPLPGGRIPRFAPRAYGPPMIGGFDAGPPVDDPVPSYPAPVEEPAPVYEGDPFVSGRPGRWFGALGALAMTRSQVNSRNLAYLNPDINAGVLNTRDSVDQQYRPGYEVRLGRVVRPTSAIEGSFWMLDNFHASKTYTGPDNIYSTVDFDTGGPVIIDNRPASLYFDAAHQQQINRTDETWNLEVNWLEQQIEPTTRWSLLGIAGIRWFHFREATQYRSAIGGTTFDQYDGGNVADYKVSVRNDLIGGQTGARIQYLITPRWRLYAMPKVGVFGNAIQSQSHLHCECADGGTGGFDLSAYKPTVSLLGQVDVGTSCQITPRISAYISYRAVGISNIALADNQLPYFAADYGYIQSVHSANSLILHGATTGMQFGY